MDIIIKLWEASQRIVWLNRKVSRYPTFNDTSILYDSLIDEIPSSQINNFYEIVCGEGREETGSILNELDCFVDEDYNVYKIITIDKDENLMQVMVNGSDYARWGLIEDSITDIIYGMKLIKSVEYYKLLDILWETKEGLYLDEKGIKRVDYKNLTKK